MGINIEVIDRNEGLGLLIVDSLVDMNFLPPLYITSVQNMVSRVKGLLGSLKMDRFYILGHGGPGYQAVGAGTHHDGTGNLSLQLGPDGELLGDGKTYLPGLRSCLAEGAVVTLGGCQVGVSPAGPALIAKISQALGNATVRAGTDDQGPRPGLQGNIVTCTGTVCGTGSTSWTPITSPF